MRVAILAALLTLSTQANAKEEANSKNIMNKSEAKAKAEKEFVNAKEDTANATMDLEQLANYKVGYAVHYRPHRDTGSGMQFVSEYAIQTNGRLRKWEVWTFRASQMLLQVFRRRHINYLAYDKVAEISHYASGGYSTTNSDIEVQAGDVLGWWARGVQPIVYTEGGKRVRSLKLNAGVWDSIDMFGGDVQTWARSYSIQATIQLPPAPTSASPHQCPSGGPQQCSHLASFSLLDEVAAFRNDQEARECMSSGMDAVTTEVSKTCTVSQVQGSLPCGTECWPILKPKILSVQSWCLEKKYSGLERYNKCLLEYSCDKPLAVECRDTDYGRGDSAGDPCYRYSTYPSWCGDYDTGNFHSYSMCCACGGGDWACPDQTAADVMKVQGASDVMEGYLSNISAQLSQRAPESPSPMTHAKNETLFLILALTGGALTAIMLGAITMRRRKGSRSSATGHLLA